MELAYRLWWLPSSVAFLASALSAPASASEARLDSASASETRLDSAAARETLRAAAFLVFLMAQIWATKRMGWVRTR